MALGFEVRDMGEMGGTDARAGRPDAGIQGDFPAERPPPQTSRRRQDAPAGGDADSGMEDRRQEKAVRAAALPCGQGGEKTRGYLACGQPIRDRRLGKSTGGTPENENDGILIPPHAGSKDA
jgi:hypothetical protein